PFEKDRDPAAEIDQEENVGEPPHQPAQKSGKPDETEIHHRRGPPDDCKRTWIAIAERRRRRLSGKPITDHARDVIALLFRDRRDLRQIPAVLRVRGGRVADDEDRRGAWNR